jgi:hypothetical protein
MQPLFALLVVVFVERAADQLAMEPTADARQLFPMRAHIEQADSHFERGLEFRGHFRHGDANVVRAAFYSVDRQFEVFDRTTTKFVCKAHDAHLVPRHDVKVWGVAKVEESALVEVALPQPAVAAWKRQAREPIEAGFDVGPQRSAHNGVAVEDEDEVW